jgi:hypothetical protein
MENFLIQIFLPLHNPFMVSINLMKLFRKPKVFLGEDQKNLPPIIIFVFMRTFNLMIFNKEDLEIVIS